MAHRGASIDDMSIRNKILLGYGVLIVPFVLLILMFWATTNRTERDVAFYQNHTIPIMGAVENVRVAGMRMISETSSYAMLSIFGRSGFDVGAPGQAASSAPAEADAAALSLAADENEEMLAARRALLAARDALLGLEHRAHAGAANLEVELLRAIGTLDSRSREVEDLVAQGAPEDAILEGLDALNESEGGFAAAANAALEAVVAEQKNHGEGLSDMLSASLSAVMILGLLCTLAAVTGGLFIAGRIGKPIRRLSEQAALVGQGDFDALDRRTTGGEVGILTGAIAKMVDDLRAMMDRMSRQQRLSALGQVAGSVGHDLRNPLATMRNSLHTLRRASAGQGFGIERILDRIDRGLDRCNAIVSDLMDFARVRELQRETVDIDHWLGELLDEHKLPEGVAVERDIAGNGEAVIDREQLRRVMINLLDNAAQAMTSQGWTAPEGRVPTISVRAQAAGPHVRLVVADNGPGISPESLARIFEPLFTTKASGVGLGLALVRQIVEQHGATIDVESQVDVGSTFTVFLPRRPAAHQSAAAQHAA